MAMYQPPAQTKMGQIIDVLVLLALTISALYIPLWMKFAGSDHSAPEVIDPTWESLGQNATMVEKWNQLGYADAASAAELITGRFDYSFSMGSLLVMIVVIVGYYAIMLKFSDKEYRDVIDEKFGGK